MTLEHQPVTRAEQKAALEGFAPGLIGNLSDLREEMRRGGGKPRSNAPSTIFSQGRRHPAPVTTTPVSRLNRSGYNGSTSQIFAADLKVFKISQDRQRDLFRIEKGLRDPLYIGGCHQLDAFH